MRLLTDIERKVMDEMPKGSYYGQIGITIRFNNHFWHEVTGTLTAGACGGDNLPTLVQTKKREIEGNVKEHKSNKKAIAVLDRCGNNWKNGKGGCGIMMNEESTPCLATMFQPFVLLKSTHRIDKKCC